MTTPALTPTTIDYLEAPLRVGDPDVAGPLAVFPLFGPEPRLAYRSFAQAAPLGATVTVYLKEPERAGALSVPLGAIDDEGRGPGVWLLERQSSSVSYRPVRFRRFDGERAIVSGEIHVGDPIIAVGGHFLHEGQRVQVAETRVAAR